MKKAYATKSVFNRIPGPLRNALILSRYSLLATLRSPTSVVFSLLFPIIFIVVFGSMVGDQPPGLKLAMGHQTAGRTYRQIDFILPGQLGFSLLMAGVFGSSFLLFSLRQSLVLKRLRATPISKRSIIGGEMLSRLFFHVFGFIIMVALGYYAFQFTLINGFLTFLEMLLFSLFGLGIFMGTGFIISGVVQNESSITPVANTITLPQILLCGLFFPVESYPHWLRSFCNILPLTFFVDGLRKIAFEGLHIWQLQKQLIGLLIWTILISIWSVRSFKWE